MTDKPVLLLDIDGVLNAQSYYQRQPPTHVWKFPLWKRAKIKSLNGMAYPFLWAQPVVDWLTGLHESEDVEIRWHSTWQEESLDVGRVLGLPEFKVHECLEWPEFEANGSALAARLVRACMPGWWKYPAAEDVVSSEGRRLIWIDDDIDAMISVGARRQMNSIYNLALVCPNDRTGITPKQMAKVDAAILNWKENPGGALSGS